MDSFRTLGSRLTAKRLALVCGAAAFVASAWLSASADTEVYKWVDPQGRMHYSDHPPPSDGKLISMESAASGHSHGSAPSQPSAPAQTVARNAPPPSAPSADPRLRAAVANDVADARADQCKAAQEKYQNYIHSRHLYREGANGERIYLTDAELDTERLNAKRESDEACAQP
jgi:hypothetical protein